ncbi:MAG: lipoyl synthase [Fibrobacteres bacterium]|nr:lipoyl synthase [Fibrobacterota bacterium]
MTERIKKPDWLRKKIFESPRKREVLELLERRKLNTVCQGAKCPNLCECFDRGTATFMIMGSNCTRRCSFCAVGKGCPTPIDSNEPIQVAEAVAELHLKHSVITSVTRDDLPDGGASHFAKTIQQIRKLSPETVIEILTPDFGGNLELLQLFEKNLPDIFNHNLETVPRLYSIRPAASYTRSLEFLAEVKKLYPAILTKSGLMVGLGETAEEINSVMSDLRKAECDIISIGQYLSPGLGNTPVVEYITPEQFDSYSVNAKSLGFKAVFSGPFVRSSYMADLVNIKKKS